LLFLDEPTTGLDSNMSFNIVETLKKMACNNRTIVCTIHQPSTDIFNMFDDVMLLSSGYVTYFGPRQDMIKYFSSIGIKCPVYTNPADFASMYHYFPYHLQKLTHFCAF
jgi:ATP-binding cassette subfamily G (WHITE) protein 1